MFNVGDTVRIAKPSNLYDKLYSEDDRFTKDYKEDMVGYVGGTAKIKMVFRNYYGIGIRCYELENVGFYLWDDSSLIPA